MLIYHEMELKIMGCPECEKELEVLTGAYFGMLLSSRGEERGEKLFHNMR